MYVYLHQAEDNLFVSLYAQEIMDKQNVLHKLHKEREVLQIIKKRKLEYFGHVIRGPKYRPLQVIMQGKIEGKKNRKEKSLMAEER